MDSSNQAAVALNLSYPLHEPSTSAAVKHAVAAMHRGNLRVDRATKRLARLSDRELSRNIVLLDNRDPETAKAFARLHVVSIRVGAWKLLPRLLMAADIGVDDSQVDVTYFDDPNGESTKSLPFFRGPAALKNPPESAADSGAFAFSSAVFRPGFESILLRFNFLGEGASDAAGDEDRRRLALALAEMTIREFTDQWSCPRALWDLPVEDTLSEFKPLGNGTNACGR